MTETGRLKRRDAASFAAPRIACSSAQRRFWLLDRINPGNPALNIAARWRLQGGATGAHLHTAFAQLVARHRALRTSIVEEDGVPAQIVEPAVSLQIPQVDLTGLAESEALAEAGRIAQLEARIGFDLSVAPLIRVTHLRVRADLSVVLVTVHRMVCDEWSMRVLARELETICAALRVGDAADLPEPPSGGERGAEQARRPSAEVRRRDRAFWKRSLLDVEHFELHPDRPRPSLQTTNGQIVSLRLERSLTGRLQLLSRASGCTLSMTALATLFTLLHRYSGETDIAIGGEVSGRGEALPDNAVGSFAGTIVRRCDLSGDPPFAAVLARVRETMVASDAHLGTSLDRLIRIVGPKRDLSRNALFSVHFRFQHALARRGDPGSVQLAELPSYSAGALHDLDFSIAERHDGWHAACEYNTDLFEPETAGRLLAHFANLLQAVANDPAQPISRLPMLDAAERQALAIDWNRTAAEYPERQTVTHLFGFQAVARPGAIAVVCGEHSLSYHELDVASDRVARGLQARGIGRGSRVGVCLDRSTDLLVALLGVLKSGAAYVPLDPAYPAARLAQIVEDAQPAIVLRTLDDVSPPSDGHPLPDAGPSPEDVAYVIYTSGSTGRPKGVQIQHRALVNLLWSMRSQPGIVADDTMLSVTTVAFDLSVPDLFLPLIVGAKLVFAQEAETGDGDALLSLLRRHHVSLMQATPVTWQILLATDRMSECGEGDTMSRFEPPLKMLCGGEAMTRQLADQLLQRPGELWNMYGPTETTVWSSALRVEPGSGPVLVGPPIANTQFYVLDAHRQLAPAGVPGELYIGGDGVALGYLNLPGLTADRFVPDPFRNVAGARLYRTGDRVRLRAQGRMEFLGRADHQIKLRGFRIELGEIESVLRAHAMVADCVVVAAADASGESAIRAYVVARTPSPGLVDDLQSGLRKALPAYMCPSFVAVLDALPRTPNGKIDRARLPAPVPPPLASGAPGRALDEPERRLAALWSAVLGVPAVDADANFFEIGGHSLLAVRLLGRIRAEFGRRLSLATLFANPTIAGQAKLLAQAQGEGDARAFDFRQVQKLQANGSRPPLIAINNTGIYYALSRRLGHDQPFTSLQLFDPALPHASLPQTMEDIAADYAQLIRRVQPAGPYTLLGWCVAGTLAFEIARQLTAAGQDVAQLVLFDTWAPGHLKRRSWLRGLLAAYAYRWKLIVADWARTRSGVQTLGTFIANRTIVKKLIAWFARREAPAGANDPIARDPALSPEQYDQWLLQHLETAAESYEPKPYAGSMTLFRSSHEPAGWFLDPQMGWGPFVDGGLEVAVIDGDHFGIFQEPSVSQMALRIEAAISQKNI